MRRSARGMPTAFSNSRARLRATFFETSRWSCIASTSWAPIVCTGFNDVIGSWKIIAMSLPRISRRRREFAVRRFSPLKSASPLVIVFLFAFSPMTVRQVTLLPDPDSPTIPSVFPFSMLKLTPSTALTIPSSVWKYVFRSFTSRSAIDASSTGSPRAALAEPDPRVYPGVQKIDEQVEEDDRQCSEDDYAHND